MSRLSIAVKHYEYKNRTADARGILSEDGKSRSPGKFHLKIIIARQRLFYQPRPLAFRDSMRYESIHASAGNSLGATHPLQRQAHSPYVKQTARPAAELSQWRGEPLLAAKQAHQQRKHESAPGPLRRKQ